MNNKNREIFDVLPTRFKYDNQSLSEYVNSIQFPPLQQVARIFQLNILELKALPTIPSFFTMKILAVKDDTFLEKDRDYIETAVAEELSTITMQIEDIRKAIRHLFLATITMTWTAFETLVSDAWIAVFDAYKGNLSYGFDLDAMFGGKSKRKFDFTRLDSIANAYQVFLLKEPLNMVWKNPYLKHLHLDRNVIVHQAGIMDDMYVSAMTSLSKHSKPSKQEKDTSLETIRQEYCQNLKYLNRPPLIVGSPIHVEARFVGHLLSHVVLAGGFILRSLDIWSQQFLE